jgi:hypothetical protein
MTTAPLDDARHPRTTVASAPLLARLVRLFAAQDVVMLGYLAVVRVLLARLAPSAEQASLARGVEACAGAILAGVLFARVIPGVPGLVRALVYRLALVGVLGANYAMLRDLLPMIRPDAVDASLLAADITLFGQEPAVWLERLNTRPVVEWFSAFYFSYYLICLGYMSTVTWVLSPGRRRLTEFATGTILVYCVGQLGYMAVPAVGPSLYMADTFRAPVDGGFFWGCVTSMVQAGSAMRDVFPSMHTCGPIWFTLFAFQQAKTDPRWRAPARVTAFMAANIVFSTVFLRWHYVVDVFAGLALAFSAGWLVPRVVRAEESLRARLGLPGVWPVTRWWPIATETSADG